METLLSKLIPISLFNELYRKVDFNVLTEVRMRLDKPLYYAEAGKYKRLDGLSVSKDDLFYTIGVATKTSLYAYNEYLAEGYITYDGGIRIGITGEGVIKNGRLSTLKNITSLCIRIPRYVEIHNEKVDSLINKFDNTLIISKPGYGKTTLLRYMIKSLSDREYNTLVLDERGELSGVVDGKLSIDLGACTDIVVGVPKITAYASQVRSMRPDIIATDEIFGEKEIECILDCIRCGVKVVATLHSDEISKVKKSPIYSRLLSDFRYVVSIIGIGNIDRVIDLRGNYA
ncbi:MAG: Flp pilus assembly complex ATPase component TadA [Clostridia bacterium]|nr:Flp pilus assembly complex ATPase component TadA [Clostridia bacterium]